MYWSWPLHFSPFKHFQLYIENNAATFFTKQIHQKKILQLVEGLVLLVLSLFRSLRMRCLLWCGFFLCLLWPTKAEVFDKVLLVSVKLHVLHSIINQRAPHLNAAQSRILLYHQDLFFLFYYTIQSQLIA